MNKSQKYDVMIIRAKMKAEESLAKMADAWFGEEMIEEESNAKGTEDRSRLGKSATRLER